MSLSGVGKWGPDHTAQEYAAGNQRNKQGDWMAASAGTEGLRHLWAFEKGD